MFIIMISVLLIITTALLCEQSTAFAPSQLGNSIIQRPCNSQPTKLYLGDFFNFGKDNEPKDTTTTEEEIEEDDGLYYDNDDPIEKIFGVFFGKKEAAPQGMARFNSERFPEQYPATLDEWAEPVEGDDAEMALLRPLLKNTNLETRKLKLTYDGNRDGFDPITFHSKVDKLGGAIVLCTTRMGIKCGGYNPKGWVG